MKRELSIQELEVLVPSGTSSVAIEAIQNLLFVQNCSKDELQKFLLYEGIVKDGDTATCESIFAAMKMPPPVVHGTAGTSRKPVIGLTTAGTPGTAASVVAWQVVVLVLLAGSAVGVYIFQDMSARVDTLQQQMMVLSGKMDETQGFVVNADKAIEAKLGDFLVTFDRGLNDAASVPTGGTAALDECLVVADGGPLPQAMACCARTSILVQTSCRMEGRCKLDTMTPPEIWQKK